MDDGRKSLKIRPIGYKMRSKKAPYFLNLGAMKSLRRQLKMMIYRITLRIKSTKGHEEREEIRAFFESEIEYCVHCK